MTPKRTKMSVWSCGACVGLRRAEESRRKGRVSKKRESRARERVGDSE